MRTALLLLVLVSCAPSDADYLDAAKEKLPPDSKIEASRVETCCANSGKMVYITIATPTGRQSCVFNVMFYNREMHVDGGGAAGCHPIGK
jgi:hypothetical protein